MSDVNESVEDNQEPTLLADLPEAARLNQDEWRNGSEAKREGKLRDLRTRAKAVMTDGWDPYKYTWSTGEVVQVAYLLSDSELLAEFGETEADVVSRTAFDLFGVTGGAEDRDGQFVRTIQWLEQARTAIVG